MKHQKVLFFRTTFALALIAVMLISVVPTPSTALKLTSKGNESIRKSMASYSNIEYYKGEKKSLDLSRNDFEKYIISHVTFMNSTKPLRIPIYTDRELLGAYPGGIGRNYDHWPSWTSTKFDAYDLLNLTPTQAVRYVHGVEDTSFPDYYFMYQSDTGARLYLFFNYSGLGGRPVTTGFPIWMRETLSYSDFEKVKQGMSIMEVAEIDSIIYDYFADGTDLSKVSPKDYESRYKAGEPIISMHLLTDGILKIVYDVVEGDIIVKNIIYSSDFTMGGLEGVDEHNFGNPPPTPDENGIIFSDANNMFSSEMWRVTNYRIQPCDYATGGKAD
ncbi:MAG: hypothetical protein GX802_02615 [Clostridiales bacterium]|nr:hypothetical protein [Clostridiales bacterium]